MNKKETFSEIDVYIETQMKRLNIPGAALAIVEGDQIVHLRGFGRARPGGETPSAQTPFFIASLAKSFTALAIMQLVEAGKVELDAPVQLYLPWFRVADPSAAAWTPASAAERSTGAGVTVRHLLNQTSGLPMGPGLAELANTDTRPGAIERQARALSGLALTRPPGAAFDYSNLNYDLLGLVVEAASGEPYSGYIQQHIFDPLEMRHSYTSQTEARKNGLAMGHRSWFGFPIPAPDLPVQPGWIISCVEDMAHYLIAHLGEGCYGNVQILSRHGIEELLRPAVAINYVKGLFLGHYGMGWLSEETGDSRIAWHSGDLPDFKAFMALLPDQKKGIVLFFNTNNAIIKIHLDDVMFGTAQLLARQPVKRPLFGAAPWLQRGLLLIPILQIIDIAITFRFIHRWRQDPQHRPGRGRMWRQHILLPSILSLLAAGTLIPMFGKLSGFLMLYSPDFSWLARICGSFAGIWTFLRTVLILRTLRKGQEK